MQRYFTRVRGLSDRHQPNLSEDLLVSARPTAVGSGQFLAMMNTPPKATRQFALMDRQITTEFLELYKDSPCLWYHGHPLYTNRDAREQAYEVLLEKYRIIQEYANIDTVKKKIDNMRTSYKRERKKVLEIRAEGGTEYKPSLWYYSLMKFLDDDDDDSTIEQSDNKSSLQLEDNFDFGDEFQEIPRRKRPKKEVASVFIPEEEELQQDNIANVSQSQRDSVNEDSGNEADAFGKTIGLQLKEMLPMQRFIAEKLISEIIFYGRLDKLNTLSTVTLNQDY